MKITEILEEMFLVYVRSEPFGCLIEVGRHDFVNAYEEAQSNELT